MIGRLIHDAIHKTALKVVLAPVVGAVYVGYKATKMGIDAANKGLEYVEERSYRAEQAKMAADPVYRARKEQEAKAAYMAAWQVELKRRRNQHRCLSCGRDLGAIDMIVSRDTHKGCIGKETFWNGL